MRRWNVTAFGLLLASAVVSAQDKQAAPKPEPPKPGSFAALEVEMREAQSAVVRPLQTTYRALTAANEELEKATTDEAKAQAKEKVAKAQEDYDKSQKDYNALLAKQPELVIEYVNKNPHAEDVLDAWVWVLRGNAKESDKAHALQALVKDHLNHPKLGSVSGVLARSYHPDADKILNHLIVHGQDDATKGLATLSLAQNRKSRSETVTALKNADEETVKRYESFYGADFVKESKNADAKALMEEAAKLFEKVSQDFADVKYGRGTLGETASGELYEFRNLAIGKTIPEIAGEDLDGVKFKISDYRGKVVMIDFWGHW